MFKIYDGRDNFFQWDVDRKLIIEDKTITQVHFCNRTDDCSLVCETYEENGQNVVNVPNILLQTDWRINVYAYDTNYTKYSDTFNVVARTKPDNYVYTETEILNYEDLENRIKNLEMGGGGDIDLTNYYTKDETNALIPDTTDFITEEEVNEKLKDIGGGGSPDLELITSVELTEDTKVVKIAQYSDGEQLRLKKAFVEVTYPATEVTGTVQIALHCHKTYGLIGYGKTSTLNTTKAQYATVYCEHLCNNIYNMISTPMGNKQNEYFAASPAISLVRKESGQGAIMQVQISGYTAQNVPAGTVINIYGVKE